MPSIKEYIKHAQAIDPANLTPEHLFDLMDQVAVRRTRKFVKEHYANELITGPDGKLVTIKFPQPKVRRIDYDLDADGLALIDAMVYALDDPTDPHAPRAWEDRARDPKRLMLARYLSSMYTVDHDLQEYQISNVGLPSVSRGSPHPRLPSPRRASPVHPRMPVALSRHTRTRMALASRLDSTIEAASLRAHRRFRDATMGFQHRGLCLR